MFYLDRYRKQLSSRFSAILLVSIILSFAFWGVSNYFLSPHKAGQDFLVNAQAVSSDRVHLMYSDYQKQNGLKKPLTAQDNERLFQRFLQEKAVTTYSHQHGFVFSPRLLASVLLKETADQFSQPLNGLTYQHFKQMNPFSESALLDQAQDQLIKQYLFEGIARSNFILPKEWKAWANYLGQSRSILYFTIHSDVFLNKMKASQEGVHAYYQAHQKAFMQGKRARLRYVLLRHIDLAHAVKPSEKALYDYYMAHESFHGEPKHQLTLTALDVHEGAGSAEKDFKPFRLAAIEDSDFSSFLKQNKQHIRVQMLKNKAWSLKRDLPAAVRRAHGAWDAGADFVVQDLSNPNRWYHVHVFSVHRDLQAHYRQNKQRIRSALIQEEVAKRFAERQDQIGDWAYEHDGDLTALSKFFNLPLHETKWLEQGRVAPQAIFHMPALQKMIFSDDFMTKNWTSEPQTLASGDVVLFRVIDHQDATVKPLTQVHHMVERHVKQAESKRYVQMQVARLRAAFKRGDSLDKIKKMSDFSWKKRTVYAYSLFDQGALKHKLLHRLTRFAFELPPLSGSGAVFKSDTGDDAYWVVALQRVHSGDMHAPTPNTMERFKKYLRNLWGKLDFRWYQQHALAQTHFDFS